MLSTVFSGEQHGLTLAASGLERIKDLQCVGPMEDIWQLVVITRKF